MKRSRAPLVLALAVSAAGAIMTALLLAPAPARTEGSPHGTLDMACSRCHTTTDWKVEGTPPGFDHATVGYPLAGAHARARCGDCHADPVFSHVGVSCLDCHADAHRGSLSTDCQRCHTTEGWEVLRPAVDLHAATRFPLVGTHASADCDACHRAGNAGDYGDAPVNCAGCHLPLYTAATNPAHAAARFSTQCDQCHAGAARDWTRTSYVHPAAFPLIGGHARAQCADCHAASYRGTSSICYDCHQRDFTAAADPDHVGADFPHDCRQCHGYVSWAGATFNHDTTGFPLRGAHQTTGCLSCHASGYAGTPSTCIGCHEADYLGTTDPDHDAKGFSHDCTLCHSVVSWAGADSLAPGRGHP